MDTRADQFIGIWNNKVGTIEQTKKCHDQNKYWVDRETQKRIIKKLDL